MYDYHRFFLFVQLQTTSRWLIGRMALLVPFPLFQNVALGTSWFYLILTAVTAVHIISLQTDPIPAYVASFFYLEIVTNWVILYRASNRDRGDNPDPESARSRYCSDCHIQQHPRSHHCSLCGHCILEHDHHCFFLGACIGMRNQRNFAVFCLYAGLGCLYLSRQIHLQLNWTADTWLEYLPLFVPFGFIVSLATEADGLYSAYMICMFNSSLTVGLFCIAVFALQLYLYAADLTLHEITRGKPPAARRRFRLARHNFLHLVIPAGLRDC